MIELNSPISIEQVENGYVIRSLSAARENSLPRESSRSVADLGELLKWVSSHFATTTCPKCRRVMRRSPYYGVSFMSGDARGLKCDRCQLFTFEGLTNWVDLPHGEMITPEKDEIIKEMARQAIRLQEQAEQDRPGPAL